MKIEIQPIEIGLPKRTAAYIDMQTYFKLGGDSSVVECTILDAEGGAILSTSVDIPTEVHTQWGLDDDFVIGYVLDFLQLVKL